MMVALLLLLYENVDCTPPSAYPKVILNFEANEFQNKLFSKLQETTQSELCYCSNQGALKWRNCRLTTENPDYQLGLTILAERRQLDTYS